VRFLTPTENKRLNELIGFLGIVAAVLAALSLLTYNPRDAAFNVSAASGEGHITQKLDGGLWVRILPTCCFSFFGFCGVPAARGGGNSGLPVVPEPGD